MTPENMAKLRSILQRHEGLRLTPYADSRGFQTIGWGHNLSAHNEDIPEIITTDQARWYFEIDFAEACSNTELYLHGQKITLDDIRFAALVDLCFNIGIGGISKFKKMLAALKANDYTTASSELLNSIYAEQVPSRAIELADMFRTGTWKG
jgi:lysozyme